MSTVPSSRQTPRRLLARSLRQGCALLALAMAMGRAPARGDSIYTQKPDDPRAVYLTKDQFPVHGDGTADDSDALQQAIDRVSSTARRIYGGKYGIISKKTSPAWHFLLMDSTFENQSLAGIRTQEVGFTLVRCSFSHMPLQSCQLAPFAPGDQCYLTSEDDARTWLVTLDNNARLSTKLFADRGGTGVIADAAGNVYLASSQLYIYDKQGRQIGMLETPERPTTLVLAGPDKQTLYIAARNSIYTIRTNSAGQ